MQQQDDPQCNSRHCKQLIMVEPRLSLTTINRFGSRLRFEVWADGTFRNLELRQRFLFQIIDHYKAKLTHPLLVLIHRIVIHLICTSETSRPIKQENSNSKYEYGQIYAIKYTIQKWWKRLLLIIISLYLAERIKISRMGFNGTQKGWWWLVRGGGGWVTRIWL